MDDEDIHEYNASIPMGEGRNPRKELVGWGNKEAWGDLEKSEVGLDISQDEWKKDPKDYILGKPLIEIGETQKKRIPVFLSESDNRPDKTGGALFVYGTNKEKEGKNESD